MLFIWSKTTNCKWGQEDLEPPCSVGPTSDSDGIVINIYKCAWYRYLWRNLISLHNLFIHNHLSTSVFFYEVLFVKKVWRKLNLVKGFKHLRSTMRLKLALMFIFMKIIIVWAFLYCFFFFQADNIGWRTVMHFLLSVWLFSLISWRL